MKLEFLILSLKNFISWARYGSCWPLTFGLACCAIEMMHSFLSKYDFDRFGILFRNSPRHADLIIIAGTITKKMGQKCLKRPLRDKINRRKRWRKRFAGWRRAGHQVKFYAGINDHRHVEDYLWRWNFVEYREKITWFCAFLCQLQKILRFYIGQKWNLFIISPLFP